MAKGSPQNRITQLEKQGQSTSASFPTVPYAGAGHHDSTTGFHPVPETLDFIWAMVQPQIASGACAWQQRIPLQGGLWTTPENPLSGTADSNPAWEENLTEFETAKIAKLYPGATYYVDDVLQQDWRFNIGNACDCDCCGGPNLPDDMWLHMAGRPGTQFEFVARNVGFRRTPGTDTWIFIGGGFVWTQNMGPLQPDFYFNGATLELVDVASQPEYYDQPFNKVMKVNCPSLTMTFFTGGQGGHYRMYLGWHDVMSVAGHNLYPPSTITESGSSTSYPAEINHDPIFTYKNAIGFGYPQAGGTSTGYSSQNVGSWITPVFELRVVKDEPIGPAAIGPATGSPFIFRMGR
jgi:hypothetical protein